MNQDEIFDFIIQEKHKQKITRDTLRETYGIKGGYDSVLSSKNGANKTVGLIYVIQLLDALGYQFVIEDKLAEWGLDERLRTLPKKLFTAGRIEARDIINREGFYARVDLFERPEDCLKFVPVPCDIYEIRPQLIRKCFDIVDHPFGAMYSYSEWISPDLIKNRVTYR